VNNGFFLFVNGYILHK